MKNLFQIFLKSEETEPATEGEVIEEQSEDSSDKEWLPGSNWLSKCDNLRKLHSQPNHFQSKTALCT